MSEETIIHFCAPTLAGIKTGSLFSSFFSSEEEMLNEIRRYNRRLRMKGVIFLSLNYDVGSGRGLIYVFRPCRLREDLADREAARLLEESGYRCDSAACCLRDLIQRIRGGKDFPHEIGLFLSYPASDVREFIRCRAAGAKCCGTWKVYGDERAAKETFRRYRLCQECCARQLAGGAALESLTVSS